MAAMITNPEIMIGILTDRFAHRARMKKILQEPPRKIAAMVERMFIVDLPSFKALIDLIDRLIK
jgi:hypothetical protein